MKCLSPSILSADFANLGEQIRVIDEAGADYVPVSYTHLTLPTKA